MDSERLDEDNIGDIVVDVGSSTLKIAFYLFILYILVSSDVFIDRILGKNLSVGHMPTTGGVAMQGMFLSMGYIALYMLVESGYI